MQDDENDPLWELLGKSRERKVSPFFVSKVMRATRQATEERPSFWAWMKRFWWLPTASAASAVAMLVMTQREAHVEHGSIAQEGTPKVDLVSEIAAVVAEREDFSPALDALLASQDHTIWLQADPSSLY